jgi:hypothetical protein
MPCHPQVAVRSPHIGENQSTGQPLLHANKYPPSLTDLLLDRNPPAEYSRPARR